MIFGDPEWIFENDENDERGGGQLKIYFILFSAIIVPDRGSYPLRGEYSPRGNPRTFSGLKLDLEFNVAGYRGGWGG